MQEHREASRDWLSWLVKKPRWVVGICAAATVVLSGFALNIEYDHNLLNLQAPTMDSVQWEKKLIEHMSDSSWYAVSWTTTPEEALALKTKYEQLPEVSTVVTVASLLPLDQDHKIEQLRDIHRRLRMLPRRAEVIEHPVPNLDDVKQTSERVVKLLTRLQKEQSNESMARLQTGLERLLNAIGRPIEAPAGPNLVQ